MKNLDIFKEDFFHDLIGFNDQKALFANNNHEEIPSTSSQLSILENWKKKRFIMVYDNSIFNIKFPESEEVNTLPKSIEITPSNKDLFEYFMN